MAAGDATSSDAIEEALALAGRLPATAIAAVFQRYGKPLEEALPLAAPDDLRLAIALEDGGEAMVRVLKLRTPVDVIANDWFVLETPGAEPLALAAPLFAAALAALARRQAQSEGQGGG